MSAPTIAVLLSTYNGERFLAQQLASLWQQTDQDFELVVRDDGSRDGTRGLLHAARAERPARVRLLEHDAARMGPKNSFACLLEHCDAPYLAFCDQDDHWLPHKLATLRAAIEAEEARSGADTPVLACSDAVVTDDALRTIHASYFVRHGIRTADGRDLALPRLLFRNYAIGATTMINAALARRSRPVPDAAVMHDWWCALVACVTGRTIVLGEALMLYRQHGDNAIGSSQRAMPANLAEARQALDWSRARVADSLCQARSLRAVVNGQACARDRSVLNRFADFGGQGPVQRAMTLAQTRAFKPGFALNALHLVACMTVRGPLAG